jgi:hypothetical protein
LRTEAWKSVISTCTWKVTIAGVGRKGIDESDRSIWKVASESIILTMDQSGLLKVFKVHDKISKIGECSTYVFVCVYIYMHTYLCL